MKNFSLLPIILTVVFVTFFVWYLGYAKRRGNHLYGREKYEKNKALGSTVVFPVIGVIIIITMLFSWQSVPPGNEPFVIMPIVFGIALILFGLYKWYRLRQSK